MNYKYILIIFLLIVNSCSTYTNTDSEIKSIQNINFKNRGFALVYNDILFKKKIVSKKIDNRSLIIFQKNLKKGTIVKIKNILNNKSIIAKVGNKAKYPIFNNSVISNRISEEINLDSNEPYIAIFEILDNSSFIAKKAKTFDEEKKVADKAPIDNISINDLNSEITNTHALGSVLYTDYIHLFQISGIILLIAMIGAIALTFQKKDNVKRQSYIEQIKRESNTSVSLIDVKSGEGVKLDD